MSNSKLYLFIYVIINHRSKDYNSKSESLSVLCVCIWEDTIMLDWFHFYCEYALFYSMSGIRLVFFRFFENKLEVGSIILSHSHFIVVCKYKKNKVAFLYSVAKSCPILWDPMDFSASDFPVLHYLPEFAHTHVRCIADVIQSSHLLSHPSPVLNLSQAWGSFPMSQFFASGGQNTRASA